MPKIVAIKPAASEAEVLKQTLSERHHSYILITCSKPASNGDMDVDMSYSGDPDLLSYLMEGAKERLV